MSNVRGILLKGRWTKEEEDAIPQIFAPLPNSWLSDNSFFSILERRKVLTDAPPTAPGHSKFEPKRSSIVVFDKGVYHNGEIDQEQFRRSIYHELAHSILSLNNGLLSRWRKDTSKDGYVDEYAKTSPEEDFADTFSEFFIHSKKTRSVVPRKHGFLRELLKQSKDSEEKIAMININSFADELVKVAMKGQALKDILLRAAKSPVTKGVGIAGGSAASAGVVAHGMGEDSGLKRGRKNVRQVAVQARGIGRREGVMMYHQALQKSLRNKSMNRG